MSYAGVSEDSKLLYWDKKSINGFFDYAPGGIPHVNECFTLYTIKIFVIIVLHKIYPPLSDSYRLFGL